MPKISIQGRLIDFPNSGTSPNYAPAIIDFAQAVADALAGVAGSYDVPPSVVALPSDVNNSISIPLLTFPTAAVRSAFIRYAIYRTSDTTTEAETGTLEIIYNTTLGTWQMSREAVGTDTKSVFTVTNIGQVQLTTTAIGGTYSGGTLSYVASAILQSE